MNKSNKLPDTSWHIGYTRKEDNDPRRHRARCIHIEKGNPPICKCKYSSAFMLNCFGSSHCKYYTESLKEWELFLERKMTKAEREKKRKIQKKNNILKNPHNINNLSLSPDMRVCPICKTFLKTLQCSYCEAKYLVSIDYSMEKIAEYASKGIIIIPLKD